MSGSGVMYYHEELKDLLHLLKHLPDTIPIGKDHDFEGFAVDGKAADELGCIKTVPISGANEIGSPADWSERAVGRMDNGKKAAGSTNWQGEWCPLCRLALIPGFIIFTSPFLIGMQEIHVIDTDAVANHWASFDGINDLPDINTVPKDQIPHILSQRISLKGFSPLLGELSLKSHNQLSVHENPS
ncbi:hypothetical protein B0H10DRAFT_2439384 [Mycena sp. CBHHK59/15]|nr:hypothetical protein B0H10DRAFT_2439384 [Mycena sp. CBHHK59/15]